MPSTGEICSLQGTYTGRCTKGHSTEAFFTPGDRFTACSTCGGQDRSPGGAVMNWTWARHTR